MRTSIVKLVTAMERAEGRAASCSMARRVVSQGGVCLNGSLVDDPSALVEFRDGAILQVGRRVREMKENEIGE